MGLDMKTALFLIAILATASTSFGELDRAELERQLKEMTKERDDLRREMAILKLKVATLETKLAAAAGDEKPATGTADSGAATTDDDDEDVDDSGVAKRGRIWDVTVISSKVMDPGDVDAQVRSLQAELKTVQGQVKSAQARVDKMRRDNEFWHLYRRDRKKPFADNVIAAARADITKLQAKERAVNIRIKSLEREKTEAQNTQIVTCETKDNLLVRLVARGPMKGTAEAMMVGRKYIVEGRKQGGDMIMLTKVTVVQE